jgi:hypothetical protein
MPRPTRTQRFPALMAALLLAALSSCRYSAVQQQTIMHTGSFTDQQLSLLASKTIFFGHQSVGDDLLEGVRDRILQDPRFKLAIVRSPHPESVPGPALIETHLGRNADPRSKNDAFAAVLERGFGSRGGIALFKYCYVDIGFQTNIQALFGEYRSLIGALKQKYPSLTVVHVTAPLTASEPALKSWVKSLLGRQTAREDNVKRNQFNALLKQAYANVDPVFDLAEAESTRPDGSRCYFRRGPEQVYELAPEYTSDGGHLNQAGRAAAADRFLRLLAAL